MRFSWVPVVVVLLDLLARLASAHGDIDLSDIRAVQDVGAALSATLQGALSLTVGVPSVANGLLLAALLASFLLLFRVGRPYLSAYPLSALGIQLCAGGALGRALVLFLGGPGAGSVTLPLDQAALALGPSELAIGVGLAALAVDLVRRAIWAKRPQLPLTPPAAAEVDLRGVRTGIDNVHIDVQLSPRFVQTVQGLLHALVAEALSPASSHSRAAHPSPRQLRYFAKLYSELMRSALHRAKEGAGRQRETLLQLAVIKLIRRELHEELTRAIQRRSDSLHRRHVLGYQATPQQNDRMAWIFRNRSRVYYRVSLRVLRLIVEQEEEPLGELREALFGASDYALRATLQAPLLCAASPDDEAVMAAHYVLMARGNTDPFTFAQLERLISGLFPGDDGGKTAGKGRGEAARLQQVRGVESTATALEPANVPILLDLNWRPHPIHGLDGARRRGRLRRHRGFQRRNRARLRMALEQADLLPRILGAYEAARLHAEHGEAHTLRALEKMVRLGQPAPGGSALAPALRAAIRRARSRGSRTVWPMLLRFTADLAAYRRDLSLLHALQQAMNQIRLLDQEQDLRRARTNHTLYQFLCREELPSERAEMRGHAVLKADVRGSTRMSEELARRGLNPASHFEQHFFQPVNGLVQRFGGEKVFIEGDAVIIQFPDYHGATGTPFPVARACDLAAEILRAVHRHNRSCAAYGLPALELGIGIAYNERPPTYLFDGEHRIVISTAIGRADRLSSTTRDPDVRARIGPGRPVAYYEPRPTDGPAAAGALIHNVNGIALEPVAFHKLCSEVRLRPAPVPAGEGRLYRAEYPDGGGKTRGLWVRELAVAPHPAGEAAPGPLARRPCYEVAVMEGVERNAAPAAETG